ncbi:hypothetical protein CYLTODRAFT_416882 [Cylindrobasidium torrendii FP15055 ss-10]|uniref:RING-type domain-containing protein n=1 Tax=Cylindrobasidium torrendii FP15055 ss-10 TaxID=1314674 RepID=A0A0D7BTK5_9AGAR|nr:hypothetical protein CYLTODRAFT_416882 [Cylindrobasidium torrendii FP15055 ss-10]
MSTVSGNLVPSKKGKGQDVNHLLNFTLPPRQQPQLSHLPRRSNRRAGNHHGIWNKERFVNAHYRFVMTPMGDYTVHFADPDIYFQWSDIVQVIIPRASALASAASGGDGASGEGHTTCPICLSPPTASRMTKCGHVFCYPCILHYLNTSEKGWARCPICFDSINDGQLKSVKWFDGPIFDTASEAVVGSSSTASSSSFAENPFEAPRAGSTMRMRLMQRPQITTLALPRSHTWPSELLPPHQAPFHFMPDVFNYSKFMLATPEYLAADLSNDLDELSIERRTLAGMDDELGVSFVDAADQKVRYQMERAAALDNVVLRSQIDKAQQAVRELEERHVRARQHRAAQAALKSADGPGESLVATPAGVVPPRPNSTTRNGPRQRRNVNPPPPSTSTYYYYQAASGLPLFLHPLDIRILLSHFASYSAFPDTIDVQIEALSEGSVNDDLRKRCKYLAHMPEGSDVVFIEADLTGVVGQDGLKNFEGPLRTRSSKRRDKEKKDDRARARAEEKEREKGLGNTVWIPSSASVPSFVESALEEPEHTQGDVSSTPPIASGAWGNRSFASTLQNPGASSGPQRTIRRDEEDEWDIDAAWHELEMRNVNVGGGRKKRSNKLVIIGGGGPSASRRR